jgi:hypothetical protein
MTTQRRPFAIGPVAVALSALLGTVAVPAWADQPLSGGGEGVITTIQITPPRVAGGNRIEERRLEGILTGTLQGTFVEHVRGVVHPDGTVTFQGTLVFTGTVEGCGEGTFTGRLQGRGQGNPPLTEASMQVVDQSASTVGVTGQGTVSQDGPLLTYSIRYRCR